MSKARPSKRCTRMIVATTLSRPLLRHSLAGTAELAREVLELRQPVLHAQHGFRIVHVDRRLERERRNRRRIDVRDAPHGMARQQMTAALRAPLPLAVLALL